MLTNEQRHLCGCLTAFDTMAWHSVTLRQCDDHARIEASDRAVLDAIREDGDCASCGHSWVRHRGGRCALCSQGCDGFYVAVLLATVEQLQAEVDRLTAALAERTAERDAADTVIEAAEALHRLHTPYGAYETWRTNGDGEAADKLSAFDQARRQLAEALRRARAAQPQEPT